jgi:hypothetical protein
MSHVPTPGWTAFGLLLIVLSIPVALSLGPLLLGVAFLVIGLRRWDAALQDAPTVARV